MVRAMTPGVTTDTLMGLAPDMSRVTGTSRATARGGRSRGRRTTDRRDTTAFGAVFGRDAWSTRRGRSVNGGAAQCSDGIQQLAPVPERADAKLLEILGRQVGRDRLIYLILAECRLILPRA